MKIGTKRHWQSCAVMILIITALMLSTEGALAHTTDLNPGVFPPESHPFGLSYAQWSAKWWQRAFSLTKPEFNDPKDCSHRQSGPVWFLNGTTSGSATRACTIPRGKAIMFPIINVAQTDITTPCGLGVPIFPSDSLMPPDKGDITLLNCDVAAINHLTEVEAEIDGRNLQGLERSTYLVISPPFGFNAIQGNAFNFEGKGRAISDGVWIILKPLSPGTHTLHFRGKAEFSEASPPYTFETETTYTLKIA